MAKELSTKFSVDLGDVVDNSITAVKNIRRNEQARKEAEFQRAIANGLSYEEQVKMREKQLEEEKASSISDADYIAVLTKSLSDTKKLKRFNNYREKYATTLANLSSGKINEEDYLSVLKNQLEGVNDPELRVEIQNDIAAAEKELKAYNDTILSNQVKLAKNDNTVATLASVIERVTIARTTALLNNNEDEVTAHDETLAALNSKLATVRIQNSLQDFQVKSTTKGTNALEKLQFMNSQVQNADISVPVRIDRGNGDVKTYVSAQEFWSLTRDNYLSDDFFKELEIDIKNNLIVNSKFGVTQGVLDGVMKTYSDLRAKPELVPFLTKLDAQQAGIMNDAATLWANNVVDIASQNRDYDNADAQLQKAANRYRVDLTSQQITLRNRNIAEVRAGEVKAGKIEPLLTPEIKEEGVITKPPEKPTTVPSAVTTPPVISKQPSVTTTSAVPSKPLVTTTPSVKETPVTVGEAPAVPQVTELPKVGDLIPGGRGLKYEQADIENLQSGTPAFSTTSIVKPVSYVIKQGDTLSGIANKFLGDAARFKEIATLNNIEDPNKILAGVTIKIPL